MPADPNLAVERYRTYADTYDKEAARNPNAAANRERVIGLLDLKRGDVVLDVGCGTGLNFQLIEEAIGLEGSIVGIDLSPEMLEHAAAAARPWSNVTLVRAAVDEAQIPVAADAVLFSLTHDILQTPAALDNVFAHTKPGARVAAYGYKWAPWWTGPWNLAIRNLTRYAITTRDGFSKPWLLLAEYVPDLEVETALMGAMYFAHGHACMQ
jgi:demethylmenaquinone methyltransferase/2-methoxy-6-polyprenyl-1,4-benzoquinol methylase